MANKDLIGQDLFDSINFFLSVYRIVNNMKKIVSHHDMTFYQNVLYSLPNCFVKNTKLPRYAWFTKLFSNISLENFLRVVFPNSCQSKLVWSRSQITFRQFGPYSPNNQEPIDFPIINSWLTTKFSLIFSVRYHTQ